MHKSYYQECLHMNLCFTKVSCALRSCHLLLHSICCGTTPNELCRSSFLYLLLRHFRQFICHVHHHIVGYGVAPYFCASLCIHSICGVGQLVEDVEAFGCKGESALAEGAYKRGIPHEVVGIHRAVAIAAAGVLLEVGGKLNAERQLIGKCHAVVVVVGVERLEVVAVACRVAPLCVGYESQTQVALLERQLQIVAKYRGVDTAQR